ncbi:MAG: DNA-binding protein [Deltaproteobacteria bacterium]|nr:DNA-binding protein [Deltaproteobacteria bacterium]
MSPDDLKNRIHVAATQFTNDVIGVFTEAFAAAAADFSAVPRKAGAKKAAPARRAPAAKTAPAPKTAKKVPGKRIRRSTAQLAKAGDQVLKLLASNKKGLRIEAINKVIGTTTRELMRPVQKLLDEKKIRKVGERRATTYFLA